MKQQQAFWPICLWILSTISGLVTAGDRVAEAADPPSGKPVPADTKAIAAVEAGREASARAAWWGFDPRDSTRSLQAAFNSPAKQIVVQNMGTPWIVTTIELPSDKEILFERGAVIEAKRGAFREKNACLFSAIGCKRLVLWGPGATLRMHKADYHKPPYELAEWRHALSLRGCEDVTIEGLTLEDSGGDGIYLGVGSSGETNRNITIRGVVCDGNNRQGISVITAENLLIEDALLRNTSGTAPQAGIDFEPNRPEERLVNCVMRNCRSENNAGHAYHLYLGNLHRESEPISIRFENCFSKGCGRNSTYVGIANRDGKQTVRGSVEYVDCHFDADHGGGVYVRGNEADGCKIQFVRCEIIRRDDAAPRPAPITIEAPRRLDLDVGNVRIDDCRIVDSLDRRPLDLIASPVTRIRNLNGRLVYTSPEGRSELTLDASQLEKWFPLHAKVAKIPRFEFDWQSAKPIAVPDFEPGISLRLRRAASLLLWGQAGVKWQLELERKAVGHATPSTGKMTLTTAGGQIIHLRPRRQDNRLTLSFTPGASGVCRLDWQGELNTTMQPVRCSVPLAVLDEPMGIRTIRPIGTLYFQVPASVQHFAVLVAGSGTAETVQAAVLDAAGRVVDRQDNIAPPHLFLLDRETSGDEVWSIQLDRATEGVMEDVSVQVLGVPPLFGLQPK